jgi:hypothetical protein
MLINPEEERELFIIRKAEELDNCDGYNLISVSPRVDVEYDRAKKYCPKYKVTFYAETPWTTKFISIVMSVTSPALHGLIEAFLFVRLLLLLCLGLSPCLLP